MIRQTLAHFSMKERIVFILSLVIFSIGIFSGIVALSNHFTVLVPRFGGTYTEGIVGSPRFINPILATSDADQDLTELVYSGLVRTGQGTTIIPDLAESWDISSDGKTYTFHLKHNLVFHDGKPLTAQDVVFTVSKITNPSLKSPLRVAWTGVTVSAADDTTVTFSLQRPYAGFLNQLTLGILPEHIWKSIADDAWLLDAHNTEPIGSGPYKIKTISRDGRGIPKLYVLQSFRKFALGKPFIKNMVISCLANTDEATLAYHRNDIYGVANISPQDTAQVADTQTTITQTPLPHVFGIFFNQTKNKAFGDPAVIHALNLAVNKPELITKVFAGYATAINGPIPQALDTGTDDYESRKTLAMKVLDTAGWKINPATGLREKMLGKEKIVLTFSLATANTPELISSAKIIANSYESIGVHIDVKVFEIGTLNENIIRGRDFQALLFGQVIKHDTDIYAFWHSSQKTDPGLNITGYTNKNVDTLLESALKETNPERRASLYTTITQELAKDAPVVFLYTPSLIYLTNEHVSHVVLPTITDTRDRFALIYQWYVLTDRVWSGLVK